MYIGGDNINKKHKETIILSNKRIINLSNAVDNDITVKKAIMLITTLDEPNLNGTIITKENATAHMDTLVNKPCLAYYYVDEDGVERLGDHEYKLELDEDGNIVGVHFNTTPIGVFTRVWIDTVGNYDPNASLEDKNKEAIFAEAILWSERFPNTMRVVEDMFDNGISVSSYEIDVYKSQITSQGKKSLIDFCFIGHTLLGVPPACPVSGIKELSQLNEDKFIMSNALRKDLKINNINKNNIIKNKKNKDFASIERGKDNMPDKNKEGKIVATKEDVFKNLAAITNNDLYSKVYRAINNVDDEWYNLSILYPYDYVAYAHTWGMDEDAFIKFTFEVKSDDTVGITGQEEVKMNFVPVEENNNDTGDSENASKELISTLKKNLAEKDKKINKNIKELSDKNDAILEIQNKLTAKEQEIATKEEKINSLKPFKEKIEKAEKEQAEKALADKRKVLKALATESGYIKEEEFTTSKELSEALEKVDEKTIKAEIADRIIAAQKEAKEKKENKTKVETETSAKVPKLDINSKTEEENKPNGIEIIKAFING